MNIPVGIAALVLTAFGQLLVIVLLGSLTYAVIEGPAPAGYNTGTWRTCPAHRSP